ncbi:MAG: SDR family oxidoreductase [Deltaproteobacteria bacterium]|nr:SDR family oxidoreductase [Deltaproteobacteria bacterium]MBI3387274.1 SDR family oxidoreductase [Deltaproteobacteria bacterium]
MGVIAVTGSASGIGAATRARLEAVGNQVIGVDLVNAEVIANLATPTGRAEAIAAVDRASRGCLDGLVVCAGVGPQTEPFSRIASLNYFGAQVLLAGLRNALAAAKPAAAVAVSSNSSTLPGMDTALVAACLDGNEVEARRLADTMDGQRVYGGSKLALARWVRRQAPTTAWAGAGIRLNAVAPGAVTTPMLQAGLEHPVFGPAIRNFPIPTGTFGKPTDVAAAIAFLLSDDASFCCGSVLFVDGGTDAMFRPDTY